MAFNGGSRARSSWNRLWERKALQSHMYVARDVLIRIAEGYAAHENSSAGTPNEERRRRTGLSDSRGGLGVNEQDAFVLLVRDDLVDMPFFGQLAQRRPCLSRRRNELSMQDISVRRNESRAQGLPWIQTDGTFSARSGGILSHACLAYREIGVVVPRLEGHCAWEGSLNRYRERAGLMETSAVIPVPSFVI